MHRWLIGGPARCGKSALARMIARGSGPLAVLQVDALMHLYLHGREPRNASEASAFIEEYLQRPRYMDPQRSVTRRPADDFEGSIGDVVRDIEFRPGMTRIELIARMLDYMAGAKGKDGWVALDLHPEFYYAEYARRIPGLRLVIVLRDPLEAIAASLYWRTYPERMDGAARQLKYAGILWRLSVACGVALRRSQGRGVCLVDGGRILAGQSGFAELPFDPSRGAFDSPAFFTSREENGQRLFYCPDGLWRALLEPGEISRIGKWRAGFWPPGGSDETGDLTFPGAGRPLWRIASSAPALAKRVIDTVYFPRAAVSRIASRMKAWA